MFRLYALSNYLTRFVLPKYWKQRENIFSVRLVFESLPGPTWRYDFVFSLYKSEVHEPAELRSLLNSLRRCPFVYRKLVFSKINLHLGLVSYHTMNPETLLTNRGHPIVPYWLFDNKNNRFLIQTAWHYYFRYFSNENTLYALFQVSFDLKLLINLKNWTFVRKFVSGRLRIRSRTIHVISWRSSVLYQQSSGLLFHR